MKALFAHDTPFFYYQGIYFSTGLNSTVLSRYTAFFENLVICGRQINTNTEVVNVNKSSLKNVEFHNIPNKNAILIWFSLKDRLHIKRLVQEVDFVIARLDSIIGFIAIDYAVQLKKPYIIELCTDPWDCYTNYGIKGKILAPFITLKTKKQVRNAKNVVYVTNKYLQSKYPNDSHNINISNVECVPNISEYKRKKALYKEINLDSDKIILGTAGALLPFKGQRFVIEALSIIKKKGYNNYYYKLAGEGADKVSLQALAKSLGVEDHIDFVGKLNRAEMVEFYNSLHIYIQPSLQEGLPRTVIEAMAQGTFCLGSKTAGIPELLPSSRIFPNKSPADIAEMIRNITNEDLVKDSKRNFEESYNYESNLLFNRRIKFIKDSVELNS